MERTPETKTKRRLSLRAKGGKKPPDHSTPEASTSRDVRQNISTELLSPIGSPGRNEIFSQKVYWETRSPDEILIQKGFDLKLDITPKADYSKYLSPKPKRKLIRQKYTEKLRSWADEFKSFQEGWKAAAEKSLENKNKEEDENKRCEQLTENICDAFTKEVSVVSRTNPEEFCTKVDVDSTSEQPCKVNQQDCLLVELTSGLNSPKSFPSNFQFPKVPKLDLECDMDKSDYVILMEDNSIEDEMIKCTQRIEEQILCQKQCEKETVLVAPPQRDATMTDAINKFTDYITSPISATNPLLNTRSPLLNRRLSLGRKCIPSSKNGPNSNSLKKSDHKVTWDCNCEMVGVKKLGVNEDEEVMGMLFDDSFDNIMLELVVEGEKNVSPNASCHVKENKCASSSSDIISKAEDETKTVDAFGMLEDDSLIQPEVLNFLDTVESQAVAASQPMKCTPEEIQKKRMEAKKKLAVGKRKRKSQLAIGASGPAITITSEGCLNR